MTANYEHALASKQEQDSELRELRQNKELLTQWERQIADIIQWVTEEKDARAYLKSVAKKLAEDVDNLKTTAGTLGRVRFIVLSHIGCFNSWSTSLKLILATYTGHTHHLVPHLTSICTTPFNEALSKSIRYWPNSLIEQSESN